MHPLPVLIAWLTLSAAPGGGTAPADTAVYEAPPVHVHGVRSRATIGGASALEAGLDSTNVGPAPTLEQVLRAMPLVVVRANSRGEAQPALRGGEDRQIAVLVDGVPITLAWDHRTDLSIVPLTAARSVRVSRGPTTLLHGPNALAGAVEVDIVRGGRPDTPPPPWVVEGGLDQSGAHGMGFGAGALRPAGGGDWLVRAGGGYRASDGFLLPRGLDGADAATAARLTADGERRRNTDIEALDGFFALRRRAAGGAWMAFTGAGLRARRGVAPEAHTADPRLWRYPFQVRGLGALSAGTGMRPTRWGTGDLEASLGIDGGRTEILAFDSLDYRTIAGSENGDDRTLTLRLLGDHTLGAGGALRAAATYGDVLHDEVLDGGPESRYRQRLWSLGTETDWRVPAALPLRLSAGVAADGADTPAAADKPALGRLWTWGGRLGATLAAREGRLLVHGAASRRARFPSLRELYSGALGRFLPNPALEPEVQWVGEVGATLKAGRAEVQLVGFHQAIADGIVRRSVSTPGGTLFQRVNQNRLGATGLEVVADAGLGGVGVGGDATLQRTRVHDGAGTAEAEYEPAAQGTIWCSWPLPRGVRAWAGARGVGAQRFLDVDSGVYETLAASLRFDLRLARSFALRGGGPLRRADLTLSLDNLGDRPVYDQAGLPQPGRTVRLAARVW